eukprot:Selendium_serpulae@DN4334_c1_g1_i1.p1
MGTPDESVSLLDVYSLTFAPLKKDTMIDEIPELSPSDLNLDLVVDELEYVSSLAAFGLAGFHRLLQDAKNSNDDTTQGSSLLCLVSFLKRMQTMMGALGDVASEAVGSYGDVLSTLKDFEESVREGHRPSNQLVHSLVDLTPNMKWESPAMSKSKVGFNEKATVFGGQESGEDKLKDEPAKPANVRGSRRHPTGYAKFAFRPEDLELDESDDGGSTSIPRSRVDSDDQRSVASTAGNQSLAHSGTDEEDMDDRKLKRSGSVGFSFDRTEEIQDQEADPNWSDKTRHMERFSRIRNRVPTGHPTIMKAASDELSGLLEEYEKAMSGMADDSETVANTSKNRGDDA